MLCADGTLYTGITNDLQRRLAAHATGKGAKYTRSHGARQLVYSEAHASRSAALTREAAVKKLTRTQKQALISAHT